MLFLIRDVIVNEKGYLNLSFRQDWTPVYYNDEEYKSEEGHSHLDHISFGHDVETGYLMIEASEILGIDNDTLTHRIAKQMIDHTISFGWDINTGAIYDGGHYFDGEKPVIINEKTAWWSACEAFNAFLLISEIYPEDSNDYYDNFTRTWNYCKNYLIDHENGGWYRVGIDKNPRSRTENKGDIWKGNYHNSRALINCIQILRSQNID